MCWRSQTLSEARIVAGSRNVFPARVVGKEIVRVAVELIPSLVKNQNVNSRRYVTMARPGKIVTLADSIIFRVTGVGTRAMCCGNMLSVTMVEEWMSSSR